MISKYMEYAWNRLSNSVWKMPRGGFYTSSESLALEIRIVLRMHQRGPHFFGSMIILPGVQIHGKWAANELEDDMLLSVSKSAYSNDEKCF